MPKVQNIGLMITNNEDDVIEEVMQLNATGEMIDRQWRE